MPLEGVPVTPGVGRTILTRTVTLAGEPVEIQQVQVNLAGETGSDVVLGVGQQPMAASVPVTLASDQSPLPFTGTITGTVDVSGSTVNIAGTVDVAGTVAISGLVDVTGSAVSITGTVDVVGTVAVTGVVTVAGTVNIGTMPTVDVATLPLPPNAAQETGGNLAAILATLNDGIGLPGSAGTWSEKAASTSAQALWAVNANRKGGSIWNNSTGVLYVLLGTGVTTAKFTAALAPLSSGIGGYFELPFGYTGAVELIWAAGAVGSAYCEEFA